MAFILFVIVVVLHTRIHFLRHGLHQLLFESRATTVASGVAGDVFQGLFKFAEMIDVLRGHANQVLLIAHLQHHNPFAGACRQAGNDF